MIHLTVNSWVSGGLFGISTLDRPWNTPSREMTFHMEMGIQMDFSRCTRELLISRAPSKRNQESTRNRQPAPAVSNSNSKITINININTNTNTNTNTSSKSNSNSNINININIINIKIITSNLPNSSSRSITLSNSSNRTKLSSNRNIPSSLNL